MHVYIKRYVKKTLVCCTLVCKSSLKYKQLFLYLYKVKLNKLLDVKVKRICPCQHNIIDSYNFKTWEITIGTFIKHCSLYITGYSKGAALRMPTYKAFLLTQNGYK